MSAAGQVAAVVAILASLFLVTRGFQGDGLARKSTFKAGLIWAAVIVGATLLVRLLGA